MSDDRSTTLVGLLVILTKSLFRFIKSIVIFALRVILFNKYTIILFCVLLFFILIVMFISHM